jgi:hypothetical protein
MTREELDKLWYDWAADQLALGEGDDEEAFVRGATSFRDFILERIWHMWPKNPIVKT